MRMKNWLLFLMIPVIGTGCATMDPTSRTIVGSQVGMLAGTVTGAVIGHAAGGYRGEAIGSFVGSVGGTVLGAAAASSQNQRDRNTASAREYQVSYLVIEDIYLEDRNNNQIVDAGESCRISFILSNEGRQTAYNIEPVIKVEQGGKYVKLSKPLVIRQLPPHKRVSYTVTLHASPKLKAGEIVLSVRLKSSDGYLTDKETFTLPAGRY
ncbi:glycine zipper family protein [Parabacteroides goldsteinii]|uniref:glycine zipper family protein n=1 Tax=Parabacteroides goldsteinii TaxID=328812 RepID=UPI0034E4FFA1